MPTKSFGALLFLLVIPIYAGLLFSTAYAQQKLVLGEADSISGLYLGAGWALSEGEPKGASCLINFEGATSNAAKASLEVLEINSMAHLERRISNSVSISGGYGPFSASAAQETARRFDIKTKSKSLFAFVEISGIQQNLRERLHSEDSATLGADREFPSLSPDLVAYLKALPKISQRISEFRSICGEGFVSALKSGGNLIFQMEFDAATYKSESDMKRKISVSFGSFVSGNLNSAELKKELTDLSVQSISFVSSGGAQHALPIDAATAAKTISEFYQSVVVDPVLTGAEISSYQSLPGVRLQMADIFSNPSFQSVVAIDNVMYWRGFVSNLLHQSRTIVDRREFSSRKSFVRNRRNLPSTSYFDEVQRRFFDLGQSSEIAEMELLRAERQLRAIGCEDEENDALSVCLESARSELIRILNLAIFRLVPLTPTIFGASEDQNGILPYDLNELVKFYNEIPVDARLMMDYKIHDQSTRRLLYAAVALHLDKDKERETKSLKKDVSFQFDSNLDNFRTAATGYIDSIENEYGISLSRQVLKGLASQSDEAAIFYFLAASCRSEILGKARSRLQSRLNISRRFGALVAFEFYGNPDRSKYNSIVEQAMQEAAIVFQTSIKNIEDNLVNGKKLDYCNFLTERHEFWTRIEADPDAFMSKLRALFLDVNYDLDLLDHLYYRLSTMFGARPGEPTTEYSKRIEKYKKFTVSEIFELPSDIFNEKGLGGIFAVNRNYFNFIISTSSSLRGENCRNLLPNSMSICESRLEFLFLLALSNRDFVTNELAFGLLGGSKL